MFTRRTCVALAGVFITVALTGCATGSDVGGSDAAPPTEQEAPSQQPSAEQPVGQAGPGEDLVNEKCTMCHTLDRVNAANFDEQGWTSTVTRMQQNGLVVTEEEKTSIIEYLAQRDASR